MKEYEEFLEKIIKTCGYDNPNNRVMMYEYQFNERMLIDKLKSVGLINNVTYMGQSYVGFDLTYDAIHYFDEAEKNKIDDINFSIKENKSYDVFLSHASKDKVTYVDDLYEALSKLDINIFYDKETITWGDKWKEKIINGTHDSEFAIIVISKNFFGREWTEKEVAEFLMQENESGQKLILPIILDISNEELNAHYPELGDIQTISTDKYNTNEIAILFANILIKRLKNIG